MSDFDKEAEREKLREKFERDRQKRAQSERMSELLLKGATMTNKHHDCGSPIFRWEGEEFCPACEGPDGAGAAEADVQEAEPGAGSGTEADVQPESAGVADATGNETEPVDGVVDMATDAGDGTAESTEIDVATESPADDADVDRTPARAAERSTRADAGTGRATTTDQTAAGEGVATARAAIERTLADVAREAEATGTDDLARKRNLIAATREAAEALEATRRAGRQ